MTKKLIPQNAIPSMVRITKMPTSLIGFNGIIHEGQSNLVDGSPIYEKPKVKFLFIRIKPLRIIRIDNNWFCQFQLKKGCWYAFAKRIGENPSYTFAEPEMCGEYEFLQGTGFDNRTFIITSLC